MSMGSNHGLPTYLGGELWGDYDSIPNKEEEARLYCLNLLFRFAAALLVLLGMLGTVVVLAYLVNHGMV